MEIKKSSQVAIGRESEYCTEAEICTPEAGAAIEGSVFSENKTPQRIRSIGGVEREQCGQRAFRCHPEDSSHAAGTSASGQGGPSGAGSVDDSEIVDAVIVDDEK